MTPEVDPLPLTSPRRRTWAWGQRIHNRRPGIVSGAIVLAIYVSLSFLNDPGGYLGTDSGSKVATLDVMSRSGSWQPDVGYWAESLDPGGELHPLAFTHRREDSWVVVTSIPALILARPLYDVGGYRAALLVPMLGSIAAAFAARRLASDHLGGDGWTAFWLTALASPMTVYALDFWEHSLGVALLAWSVVALLGALRGRLWLGSVAGLAIGAAATMRTEALVYGFVATGLACVFALFRRVGVGRVSAVGVQVSVAMGAVLAANSYLESVASGRARSTRVGATASAAVGDPFDRVHEAVITSVGLLARSDRAALVIGAMFCAALIALHPAATRRPATLRYLGAFVAIGVLVRIASGPGFVPGLLAATPLAAVGLSFLRRSRAHLLIGGIAVCSLPLVWATQFLGGAIPQWAGRYILTTGLLLGVLGAAHLAQTPIAVQRIAVGWAVAVTVIGLAWLNVRTHDFAEAGATLAARTEPVLVFDEPFLAREFGPLATQERWLTVSTPDQLCQAADVVERLGFERFALVKVSGTAPSGIGPFQAGPTERVHLIDGFHTKVTPYARIIGERVFDSGERVVSCPGG